MENRGQWIRGLHTFTASTIAILLCITVLMPSNASGFELYTGNDLDISLDSTLSYGLQYRVQDRDEGIVGIANGGEAYSVNYDDGNLNYDKGLVSNAIKLTSELDVKWRQFGAFVRGSAFYDFEVMDGDTERTPLSDEAEDAIGKSAELLDAYIWAQHEFGTVPVQVRLGDQVVSWGESTFIMGGINTINPVDVSKIRVPGAELKEALVPEGMVWGSIGLTENVNLEGLYLYDWEATEIDETGTYFSKADFVGKNISTSKLLLGYGRVPDQGDLPVDDTFLAASRDPSIEPSDQGQYGVALRAVVPALNSTDFGFYYLRYHARTPTLTVRSGTDEGLANAAAAAGAVIGAGGTAAQAAAVATNAYIKTAGYYTEYVEDLDLFGVSFSTELFGIGWQGEVSYRPDAPVQIDDAELLLHILGPLNPALGALSQLGPGTQTNQQIQGYIERDVYQVQSTFTYFLNPGALGYDSGILLAEIGWQHVDNMPDKDELRMEVSPTYTPGDPVSAAAFNVPATDSDDFADADSWGYSLLCRVNYNNLIGAVTVSPMVAWAHDVQGNSIFGGPFLEGRQALTLGTGFSYLSWSADLSYTRYMGNEEQNLGHDRDFIGFNIKYDF